MKILYWSASSVLVLLLLGCNKTEVVCSGEMSTATTIDLVKRTIAEGVNDDLQQAKFPIDKSKVSALLNTLAITLTDIRTSQKDPNSTKSFCKANLNVQFSSEIIADADKARKAVATPSIIDFVRENGLKFEANKLTGDFEYSVQPTDDGKKVYSEIIKVQQPIVVTKEIVATALVRSIFDAQQSKNVSGVGSIVASAKEKMETDTRNAEIATRNAQLSLENEKLNAEKATLELEKAKIAIKDANDQINIVWNSATKTQKDSALSDQRIWLKQRELDCKTKSTAQFPTDFTMQEATRLFCEAEVTRPRTEVLKRLFAS